MQSWIYTQDTTDLRDHLYQRKGRLHARLVPKQAKSQLSNSERKRGQPLCVTHKIQKDEQAPIVKEGNNIDNIVQQAMNQINNICDERKLAHQGLNMIKEANLPFIEVILT